MTGCVQWFVRFFFSWRKSQQNCSVFEVASFTAAGLHISNFNEWPPEGHQVIFSNKKWLRFISETQQRHNRIVTFVPWRLEAHTRAALDWCYRGLHGGPFFVLIIKNSLIGSLRAAPDALEINEVTSLFIKISDRSLSLTSLDSKDEL